MKADFKNSHPKPPGQRRRGKRELKRPNSKRGATANKAGHAGWPWLVAGILIGLFVAFIWYLNQHAPTLPPAGQPESVVPAANEAAPKSTTIVPRAEPSQATTTTQPEAVTQPAESESATAEPNAPDWHFYQLLEDQKVEVPVGKIRAPRASKVPDPNQRLVLQVGSFRKQADAERMKAQLALMGYESDIVVTKSEKYGTWHRVRIGPYDDSRKLAKDRAQLYTQNIESLAIKITQ